MIDHHKHMAANWHQIRGKSDLKTLDIYDKFRTAHGEIKDCLFAPNFDEFSEEVKNALEAVSSVLYMAEGLVAKDE